MDESFYNHKDQHIRNRTYQPATDVFEISDKQAAIFEDPPFYQSFADPYPKRAFEEDPAYPSPVQEKRICLEDQSMFHHPSLALDPFHYAPFGRESLYQQDPAFNQAPLSPISPISPVHRPVILKTLAPVRALVKAKKPSPPKPKEIPLVLPALLESDNGKRKWELIKSVGKGGCGEVYLGKELGTSSSAFVAIKMIKDRKQFLSELNTMKTLNDHRYGRGYTPKLITSLKKKKTLVMEVLSDTLSMRFDRCGYRFSLKTICMLALNMVFGLLI